MKETHFYLAPSCGSVPESLRHWYIDDYSRDEVACIARGIVVKDANSTSIAFFAYRRR